jgi:hypothetical protein
MVVALSMEWSTYSNQILEWSNTFFFFFFEPSNVPSLIIKMIPKIGIWGYKRSLFTAYTRNSRTSSSHAMSKNLAEASFARAWATLLGFLPT